MAENALAYPGDVNALAGGAAGAQSSNALARPSPLSWEGMRDNLSNLYHSLAEGGLYFTPAAIPLSARDAYNAATTPPEESKLSPLNVQGNRTPDLSTLQGWKSGLSDLYQSGGDTGLALTGMFAGPKAKTADLSKMNRAAAMESAGHSPDTIWKETGWFKGADGKWKFEIPDNEAKWKGPDWQSIQPGTNVKGPLSGFLEHPQMRDAYPELSNLETSYFRIDPDKLRPGQSIPSGTYNPTTGRVALKAAPVDFVDPKSTALHEGQHFIQGEEGFARGANSAEYASGPMFNQKARDLQGDLSKYLTGGLMSKPPELAQILRHGDPVELTQIAAKHGFPSVEEAMKFLAREDELRTPFSQYRRTAGEVEARNVQARMNMTPEERMLTPPWKTQDVPNEQQIVRFGNDGVQESRTDPAWFGRSRALDADGSPLIVYHATKSEPFAEFDPQRIGASEGIYFNRNKEDVTNYGHNILPAHLKIERPAPSYDAYMSDKSNKYDGLISGTAYVVRKPDQVKAAGPWITPRNEGVQESRNAIGGQSIDPARRAEIQKWLNDQGIK